MIERVQQLPLLLLHLQRELQARNGWPGYTPPRPPPRAASTPSPELQRDPEHLQRQLEARDSWSATAPTAPAQMGATDGDQMPLFKSPEVAQAVRRITELEELLRNPHPDQTSSLHDRIAELEEQLPPTREWEPHTKRMEELEQQLMQSREQQQHSAAEETALREKVAELWGLLSEELSKQHDGDLRLTCCVTLIHNLALCLAL